MPTDPPVPSQTPLTQTTSDSPGSGGGGGIFVVILLILLLGGGAAYYFLLYKPVAAATPLATPTPVALAKPTPATTPDTSGNATYGNAQRADYIQRASSSFVALRDVKLQPFNDSFKALTDSGGVSAVGLTSKDAIAARRALVAKCIATNDDYQGFVKTQEAAFKAELQKTPLIPNDVDYVSSDYASKAQTDKNVQLRDARRESLKTADEILAFLDKSFGNWSLNAQQHLAFKKPADMSAFVAIQKTYNDQVATMGKLRDEIVAANDPAAVASPATSPASSVAPVPPAASPTSTATP